MPRFRVFRLTNALDEKEAKQLASLRAVIAEARQLLETNPRPDSFAGRKTQEPFPSQDDRKWKIP